MSTTALQKILMTENKRDVVMIFSASTGGGHNLAANSLKKGLDERGYDARVINAFGETPSLNRLVVKGYKDLVEKLPKLYHTFYYQWDKVTKSQKLFFNTITRIMNPELLPMIYDLDPSLIVSTHPFVTNKMGTLKKNGAFSAPILSFVTDYKIHGFYINPIVDAYVVGSEYTKKGMIERGVPADIIFPFGIPIREDFEKPCACVKNAEGDIQGTILMMAGSLGAKQMEKAFRAVMKVDKHIRLIVICGQNEKMGKNLQKIAESFENSNKIVEIHGFVENVSELMDQSDIIVTKPGGLTTTESIVKGIPMLIPFYYPGQEEDNVEFIVESGMGIKVEDMNRMTEMIEFLLDNNIIIHEMSRNMSENAKTLSRKSTLDLCEKMIADYNKTGLKNTPPEKQNRLYKFFNK